MKIFLKGRKRPGGREVEVEYKPAVDLVQGVYDGVTTATNIPNGGFSFLRWSRLSSGEELLDRTDDEAPLFLSPGCYAIMVEVVSEVALTANGWAYMQTYMADLSGIGAVDSYHPQGGMSVSGTIVVDDITQPLQVGVENHDGAASRHFEIASAVIVKLS